MLIIIIIFVLFGDVVIIIGLVIPRVLSMTSLVFFTAVTVNAITGVWLGKRERIS